MSPIEELLVWAVMLVADAAHVATGGSLYACHVLRLYRRAVGGRLPYRPPSWRAVCRIASSEGG